jgi:hypothetical protein
VAEKLAHDAPTPDPDADADAPGEGTTFMELAEVAKVAAAEIDTSDGVDGEEVADAALAAAGKVVPLSHHAISELRRLLVPIISAIIAALAGGGFVEWRVGEAKDNAVREAEIRAEERIKAGEERARELERLRTEIRKRVMLDASWDDVGATLEVDEAKILVDVGSAPDSLDPDVLADLIHDEVANVQAQTALPPRPTAQPNEPQPAAPR